MYLAQSSKFLIGVEQATRSHPSIVSVCHPRADSVLEDGESRRESVLLMLGEIVLRRRILILIFLPRDRINMGLTMSGWFDQVLN